MIHSATSSYLGEAQIHHAGYRETNEVELTINNLPQVVSDLDGETIVKDFTRRVMAFGMITSPANVGTADRVDPKIFVKVEFSYSGLLKSETASFSLEI